MNQNQTPATGADVNHSEAKVHCSAWLGDRQLALQLLNSEHPLEQFEIFVKATGLKWHGLFSGYDCDTEDAENRATMKAFGVFCALWEEVFNREGVKSPNASSSATRPAGAEQQPKDL